MTNLIRVFIVIDIIDHIPLSAMVSVNCCQANGEVIHENLWKFQYPPISSLFLMLFTHFLLSFLLPIVGRNSSYKQNADGLTRPNGRFQLNAVRNIQTERNETSSKSNEHCDISHKISRRRKLEDVENRSSNDIVYDLSKRPKLHESNGPNERRAW